MPSQGRPVLGIDVSADEIRAVELSGRWPNPQILHAAAVATPAGAIAGGRILSPEAVANTTRSLIARMGASTRNAVIGISDRSVIARVLEIPRVPERETRTVVQGELEHYQILRAEGGAFDFIKLQPVGRDSSEAPQALVMAAEEQFVIEYRQVANRAGLHMAALEPVSLGLFRAAYGQLLSHSTAVCLTISYGRAEIIFLDDGKMRLFRRLDIGIDDVLYGRQPSERTHPIDQTAVMPTERILLGNEEDESDTRKLDVEHAGPIVTTAANSLATDLQRSIDYYRREYPQAREIARVVFASNDPEAEPIAEWLAQALHIEVVVAAPPSEGFASGEMALPGGLRYAGAAGLAMRELAGLPAPVPRFDLSLQERTEPEVQVARTRLAVALVSSILLVMLGIGGSYLFGMRANTVEHGLGHAQDTLMALQQSYRSRTAQAEQQITQLRALQGRGYPVPRIVDFVAGTMDPQAGLTGFSLDTTGKISLTGEASNERAMIRTLESLRQLPYFADTALDSFDSNAIVGNQSQRPVVRFQISSRVMGAANTQTASASGAPGGSR